MKLEKNEIHVWSTHLILTQEQEQEKRLILSSDELERADRFHFDTHSTRFIAARSFLREILSLYLQTAPSLIHFSYAEKGKPFLPDSPINFNVAHSHDIGIYAVTLDHAIGIDIEKMSENNRADLAKRFFSAQENSILEQLPDYQKIAAFYQLWARKEALIKAIGKGLSISLSTFSVSLKDEIDTIQVEQEKWTLLPLTIAPDYASALATNQPVRSLTYWQFSDQKPKIDKVIKW